MDAVTSEAGAVVSIVVPTYNSAPYLPATLASVRGQTFTDWEIILVDDGSTDDTLTISDEAARHDPRIRVVRAEHGGVARARNRGLAEVSPHAEFVAFLDSDDTYEPDALASLVSALRAHPELPAAHGLARAVDPQGQRIEGDDLPERMRNRFELRDGQQVPLPASAPTSFEAELVENYVVTPGTSLIRRTVFALLGDFAPATDPADDYDMNLRIARSGGFALVERVILNWRRHPTSLSQRSRRWFWAHLEVLRRAAEYSGNSPTQRAAALGALRTTATTLRRRAFTQLGTGRVSGWARTMAGAGIYLSLYLMLSVGSAPLASLPDRASWRQS